MNDIEKKVNELKGIMDKGNLKDIVEIYNRGVKDGIRIGEKKRTIKLLLRIASVLCFVSAAFSAVSLIKKLWENKKTSKEDDLEEEFDTAEE